MPTEDLADVPRAEEVDNVLDHRAGGRISSALRRTPIRARARAGRGRIFSIRPGHEIVERAHALEQRHILEGARDAPEAAA